MMKLIEDLGVMYPKPGLTTKYRMGIYECAECGAHTVCNTSQVNKSDRDTCNDCSNKRKASPVKELKQEEFAMIIVEDLGRVPFGNDSRNVHRAIFECCTCKKHIECKVSGKAIKVQTECLACSNSHNNVKHMDSGSRLYKIHQDMHNRCYNPKKKFSEYYIEKGIIVCDEWLRNYDNFKEWSMANGYTEELTLDRRDNDKGYSPDNCRWTTKAVQQRNTRVIRKGNTTGYRGVSQRGSLYRTRITVNWEQIQIGTFETPIEAAKAYDKYVIENNLEHTINNVLSTEELESLVITHDTVESP